MHFDDRLATVLNAQVTGENTARTQYRQLLDLLGRLPGNAHAPLVESGFERLLALSQTIPAVQRARILQDRSLRLENPRLLTMLAGDSAEIAAAAIACARLTDRQWERLIPRLPVRARGFLRHRRDLGPGPSNLLARLGVTDLVLPGPAAANDMEIPAVAPVSRQPASTPAAANDTIGAYRPVAGVDQEEIGTLLRRIEAFRKSREAPVPPGNGPDSPRLPFSEKPAGAQLTSLRAFDFATDANGRVSWADPVVAPMIVGTMIRSTLAGTAAQTAMTRHQPIVNGRLDLAGAEVIDGTWQIDAAPRFTGDGGRFTGYSGRLRRPPAAGSGEEDGEAQRIREMLHELRTPVNAIQGFAEIIQQQLFGPTPHEYRAIAASIAADAAKLLAGFDELDRLARLESGALELDPGSCDFVAELKSTASQLEPFLGARKADFVLQDSEAPLRPVAIAKPDAEKLAWRILATLATACTPGEDMQISMHEDEDFQRLTIELPIAYADRPDIFAASTPTGSVALSSGMFGPGFSMRLARAEVRAAGGDLVREEDNLILTLPFYKEPFADNGEAAA